jgi:4-amino-4-deoxy-L-arabinose transferase-like glycosyltransferase
VFAAGLGVRLVRFSDPPLDFHPTRQYRSALLARRLYLESLPASPQWRLDLARANAPPFYEPPVLERLTALAYRLRGGEDLRIPRGLSVLAWLMGGVFVFGLAARVAGTSGALTSVAFFLLAPFGVEASRSFQPDPLMVALLAAAAWALMVYADNPRLVVLLLPALTGSLAVLVKPMAIFQIAGGIAAVLFVSRRQLGRAWLVHAAAFALGTALPMAPYYFVQWVQGGPARLVAQQSVIPSLLLTGTFWVGWTGQVWKTCGLVAPAAGVLGIAVARERRAKALLAGLFAGYGVFVLTFSYPGSTHDYYHLQLIPIVAVGLAPLAERGVEILRRGAARPRAALAVASAVFAAACCDAAISARSRLRAHHFEREVSRYREVGEKTGHAPSNVLLADSYAMPLKYHGELGGYDWPRWYDFELAKLMGVPQPSAPERLRSILDASRPRFFVVTVPGDLAAPSELGSLLESRYLRHATGDGYVVYDLTRPPGAPLAGGATELDSSPR